MGSRSSRPFHSSPDDVQKNLIWTLDESCYWEDEASVAKMILHEANQIRTTHQSKRPTSILDLQNQVQTVMSQVDVILQREKQYSKSDKKQPTEYPAAHPVHSNLASRSFATAATEQLASSVQVIGSSGAMVEKSLVPGGQAMVTASNTITTTGILNTGTTVTSVPTIPVGTKATIIEGAVDLQNTHTASPPMIDANELNRKGLSTDTNSPQLLQQFRVELSAKFLFIYSLMTKLIVASEHCYKLHRREQSLKKANKQSHQKDADFEQIQKNHQVCMNALAASLENFDQAREAIQWLRRDYELSYARYQIQEQLMFTKEMRNSHQYETTDNAATNNAQSSKVTNDGLVDKHKPTANENEIKQLDDLVTNLSSTHESLELSVEHNERRAMNIALDYLDTNNDGKLRLEDCPGLSAPLFAVLQGSKGMISRDSMNRGMMSLSKRIGEAYARLSELEKNTSSGHVNNEELRRIRDQYEHDRASLRAINLYFHNYFVQHIFNALNEDVKQESIDIGFLQQQLNSVEKQSALVSDPMSDHLGRDIPNLAETMNTGAIQNNQTNTNIVKVENILAPSKGDTTGLLGNGTGTTTTTTTTTTHK